jgi:hypothetical protein
LAYIFAVIVKSLALVVNDISTEERALPDGECHKWWIAEHVFRSAPVHYAVSGTFLRLIR